MRKPGKKGVAKASELFKNLLQPEREILETPDHQEEKEESRPIRYDNKFDNPLYQAKRKKVAEYYPIYSDKTGAWQADLMFMDYTNASDQTKSHSFLCMVNINTRYAFVRQLLFNRLTGKKDEDELWKGGKHSTPGKRMKKISAQKSAVACKTALENIINEDIKKEQTYLRGRGMPKDHKIEVNVIYTDEGGEFMGAFDQYCREHGIRHVIFKPGEGKKTRLAIVERFNQTLRRYYEDWIDKNPGQNKYFPNVIPKIMAEYNRNLDHKGLRKFAKHLAKGKNLERKFKLTPALMMLNPDMEKDYVNYKKEREEDVDMQQAEDIAKLLKKPKVRFFKSVLNKKNQFAKGARGTLGPPVDVLGPNPNKGVSWELNYKNKENKKNMKLMPYDLIIK